MDHRILSPSDSNAANVELRFVARKKDLRSLAFPCDAAGRVDLAALCEFERNKYLFARALMGRDYALPVVMPCNR